MLFDFLIRSLISISKDLLAFNIFGNRIDREEERIRVYSTENQFFVMHLIVNLSDAHNHMTYIDVVRQPGIVETHSSRLIHCSQNEKQNYSFLNS